MKRSVGIISLCLLFIAGQAQDFTGVQQLVARRFPFMKGKVVFKKNAAGELPGEGFRMYSQNGKLVVEATTVSSASYAVNHYLKQYCHMNFSHNGSNVSNLVKLPAIKDTVTTPFRYRYALNYCTYNYTFSFYKWADWEKELDWMALNGVNLMLAQMGTEEVWVKVLQSVGYTDKEIKAFIPGPAFNAWWLMGNLEGWGGPVTDNIIHQWTTLQQKILKRMHELGIEPILQSFWGMVPHSLKEKYPAVKIIDQGKWAGGFQRPAVLLPGDTLFTKMADVYYRELKRLYGSDIHFFGGDLFHEGGKTEGIDIKNTAATIAAIRQKYFPNSIWVLQGWGGNPKKELLAGLNPSSTLVIDLFGESGNNWETTHAYYGTPWLWCTINNFGGKVGMGAQLPHIIKEPHRALTTPEGKLMQGIGIIPEGITNNPVVYDWALQTAWTNGTPSTDEYLQQYILYRYGKWDDDLHKGWQLLLQSMYADNRSKSEGGFESVFCARPDTAITHVSSWGPGNINYDTKIPGAALLLFRKAALKFANSSAYKYDLIDLARQVLADRARDIYKNCMQAFKEKSIKEFHSYKNQFISLLKLQDSLLATHPDFMLGTWLHKAKNYGSTPEEKRLCEWNARTQITYWGADNPQTDLHEYAHKEWSGILVDFYLPRWMLFFDELESRLQGNAPKAVDYFSFEKAWTVKQNIFPTTGKGDFIKEVDRIISITR